MIPLAQLPCTAASVVAQHLPTHTASPAQLLALQALCGTEGFCWPDNRILGIAVQAWVLRLTFRHDWRAVRQLLRAHARQVQFGCLLRQWLRHCDDYPADAGAWLHAWLTVPGARWCPNCLRDTLAWLRAHPPPCARLKRVQKLLERNPKLLAFCKAFPHDLCTVGRLDRQSRAHRRPARRRAAAPRP